MSNTIVEFAQLGFFLHLIVFAVVLWMLLGTFFQMEDPEQD